MDYSLDYLLVSLQRNFSGLADGIGSSADSIEPAIDVLPKRAPQRSGKSSLRRSLGLIPWGPAFSKAQAINRHCCL
jgi:hypothetical protein